MNDPAPAFVETTADLGDCRLLLGLADGEARRLAGLLAGMDPWHRLGIGESALSGYLLRPDPALRRYAVRVGGQLAGLICVRFPWLRGPFIELLGLGETFQGRGLGTRLLGWAEAEARRESKNLWVSASAFNAGARRFYRRHGFAEVAELEGLVSPGQAEILFRKSWS